MAQKLLISANSGNISTAPIPGALLCNSLQYLLCNAVMNGRRGRDRSPMFGQHLEYLIWAFYE
eukprot:8750405-Karenia_brevis.AAC.1